MRIAYFDILSGISGDMTLGACVSAGVPFDMLRDELRKLPLSGYSISQRLLDRSMISAVKIDVLPDDGVHEHHHRGFGDIAAIIDASSLSDTVKADARAMFLRLAEAEAHVHNTTVDKVHFHEVGAVDSIVDIVGVAICMDYLNVDRIHTSAVRTGSGGTVQTQHGTMPVPTPATIEILKDYPIELTDIPFELTTPTGATIVATLSDGVMDRSIPMHIEAIGYGAGGREIPGTANMLRLLVGRIADELEDEEQLLQFETNIDDMNPELFPHVIARLLETGAKDAWLTHIEMKKGRPAQMLSALAAKELRQDILNVLYSESTTAGVRIIPVSRHKITRSSESVETRFGKVLVKSIGAGEHLRRVPEYEECLRIAREHNLPLIQIYRQIEKDLSSL
ncbi:MAG: TIGR00299 family protein [Ignavibacteria bacterium]|nr:MAG: TIGR00299 family protein [Ignavibacteria bacterium]